LGVKLTGIMRKGKSGAFHGLQVLVMMMLIDAPVRSARELTKRSLQVCMRLFCSDISCSQTTAGGYRGTSDSESRTKR
jgi:hypothetical protein